MAVIVTENALKISVLLPGRSRNTLIDDGTVVRKDTERHDSTADVITAGVE
jgi:hypothetical protein